MYKLEVTVSGLCLVSVKGALKSEAATNVWAEIPTVDGHVTQLSFRRKDLVDYMATINVLKAQGRKLSRFFGPDGEDILALELGEGKGRFLLPDDQPETPQPIGMQWITETSMRGPTSESLMDWLLTTLDLGMKVATRPNTQVALPRGVMGSKNIYRDQDGNILIYKTGGLGRIHACSDDVRVMSDVGSLVGPPSPPVRFQWADGKGNLEIPFRPFQNRVLAICLANDDRLVPASDDGAINDPSGDLLLLAKAVGHVGALKKIEQQTPGSTGGKACPQAIYFLD